MDYLTKMTQDLIERLTSKTFEDIEFSNLILQMCRELTRQDEEAFSKKTEEIIKLKPKNIGISPYHTLDETSKLMTVFNEVNQVNNAGDVGGSASSTTSIAHDQELIKEEVISSF